MAGAWISASFILISSYLSCSAGQNIKAVIGENKILPCRAENGPISVVEWKRTDIMKENVLRYRNDAEDTENQHPSFKDRVVFQDIEMKDGDVSLVLINVRMNDAGTYEAGVAYHGTNDKANLTCTIHLDVAPTPPPTPPPTSPPPPPSGSFPSWAIALLVIAAVLVLLVLILIGYLLYRRLRSNSVPQVEAGEEAVSLQDIASAQTEEQINEQVHVAGEQNQTYRNGTTMNGHLLRTEDTNGHSMGEA